MGKYILDIPNKLHDELRHKSIDEEKEMKELILEGIKERLTTTRKKAKATIPKGTSTVVFELRLWNPAHKGYDDRKKEYKGKKSRFNYYDGVLRLKKHGWQDHFHSPGELLEMLEEWFRKSVDMELRA